MQPSQEVMYSHQFSHPNIPLHFHFTSPPPNITSPMSDKNPTPKPRNVSRVISTNQSPPSSNLDYDSKPLIEFSSGGEEDEDIRDENGEKIKASHSHSTRRLSAKPISDYDKSSSPATTDDDVVEVKYKSYYPADEADDEDGGEESELEGGNKNRKWFENQQRVAAHRKHYHAQSREEQKLPITESQSSSPQLSISNNNVSSTTQNIDQSNAGFRMATPGWGRDTREDDDADEDSTPITLAESVNVIPTNLTGRPPSPGHAVGVRACAKVWEDPKGWPQGLQQFWTQHRQTNSVPNIPSSSVLGNSRQGSAGEDNGEDEIVFPRRNQSISGPSMGSKGFSDGVRSTNAQTISYNQELASSGKTSHSQWSSPPRVGSDFSESELGSPAFSNADPRWRDTPNTPYLQSPLVEKDQLNDHRDGESSPSGYSYNYDDESSRAGDKRKEFRGKLPLPPPFGFDEGGNLNEGSFGDLVVQDKVRSNTDRDHNGYQEQLQAGNLGLNFNPNSSEFVPRHMQPSSDGSQQPTHQRPQSPHNRLSSPGPSPLRNEQKFDAPTQEPSVSYPQMHPTTLPLNYSAQGLMYQGPSQWQPPLQGPSQLVNGQLVNGPIINGAIPGPYINGQHASMYGNRVQEVQDGPNHIQTRTSRSMSNGSNASSASNVSLPFNQVPVTNVPLASGIPANLPGNVTVDQLRQLVMLVRPPSRGINLAVEALPSIGSALQQAQPPYPAIPPQMPFPAVRPSAIPPHVFGSAGYPGQIPLPPTQSPYSRAEIQAQLDGRQPKFGPGVQPPLSPVSSQASTIRGNSSVHALPPGVLQTLTPEALQTLINQPALSDLVLRLTGMRAPSSNPSSGDEDSQDSLGPSGNNRKAGLYKTELCRSWEEKGSCRYGAKCQFAHGREELKIVHRHPKYKTEVCRTFWLHGSCPYGKRCCFIHTTVPNAAQHPLPDAAQLMAAGLAPEKPANGQPQEPVSRLHQRMSTSGSKSSFGPSLSSYLGPSSSSGASGDEQPTRSRESSISSSNGAAMAHQRSSSLGSPASFNGAALIGHTPNRSSLDNADLPRHYLSVDNHQRSLPNTPASAPVRDPLLSQSHPPQHPALQRSSTDGEGYSNNLSSSVGRNGYSSSNWQSAAYYQNNQQPVSFKSGSVDMKSTTTWSNFSNNQGPQHSIRPVGERRGFSSDEESSKRLF